jgi:hypothetical protein
MIIEDGIADSFTHEHEFVIAFAFVLLFVMWLQQSWLPLAARG